MLFFCRIFLPIAQCLYSITDDNKESIAFCRRDEILSSLQSLAQRTEDTSLSRLFQAAILGTFCRFFFFFRSMYTYKPFILLSISSIECFILCDWCTAKLAIFSSFHASYAGDFVFCV